MVHHFRENFDKIMGGGEKCVKKGIKVLKRVVMLIER